MENWILGMLSVFFVAGYFYKTVLFQQKKNIQTVWSDNKYELAMAGIFLAGFLSRLLFIRTMPAGLNQDEASIGYESFAILSQGVDRNGVSIPVHLIAWGSGQNALYAYLAMPFIKILGLNEFSLRLPMALIGCLAVAAFYYLLKMMTGKRETLIGTLVFALAPWHIMKSRWALESNLFPDLVLFFVTLFLIGMKKKDKKYYYFSFLILSLSTYSYGTSYFFVPIFLGTLLVYLIAKKQINWKDLVGPSIMLFLVVVPMLLFVMINTFDMEQIKLGFITIPKLYVSRHTEMSSIFSGDFFGNFSANLKTSLDIVVKGEDGLPWNSISPYGICYNFSMVFLVIGIAVSIFQSSWLKDKYLMNIWGIVAFLLMGVVDPNINRLNITWIPMIYFIAVGVIACIRESKVILGSVVVCYLAGFLVFSNEYQTDFQENIGGYFFESLGDAIAEANTQNTDVIYVTNEVNQPYIFTLFYDKTMPKEYRESVTFQSQYSAFEQILSYGKYVFYIPENLDQQNAAYIVSSGYAATLDRNVYDVTDFKRYSVVTVK